MAGKTDMDGSFGNRTIEAIRNQNWPQAQSEFNLLQWQLAEPMRNIGCRFRWNALSGYPGPGVLTLQPFNEIIYDNGGFFDPSLVVPIIPPGCAGPYTITAYLRLDAAGPSAAGSLLLVQQNGIALARQMFHMVAFSSATVTVGTYCQVGDRIDMGFYNTGAGFNAAQSGTNNLDPASPSITLTLNS